jgi:hypothetical protein
MLESGPSGSVRGVLSNEHPYREPTQVDLPPTVPKRPELAACRTTSLERARSFRSAKKL